MSEQEALLWCQYQCVRNAKCNSFVFNKADAICYWTSFNRCADPGQPLYNVTGLRSYDVRNGSLPQPYNSCYSSCSSGNNTNCWQCGRPSCRGPKCIDCAFYCWAEQLYNRTKVTAVWSDPQLATSLYVPCDKGWQMIWGYFNITQPPKFNVYPLLLNTSLVLRLVVVYQDASVLYSYFDNFTYAGLDKISVGSYLGGNAGNYWEAPFVNLPVAFNSSCPIFYPTNSTTCVPGSGYNSNFFWFTGSPAFDAIGVSQFQLWVIPNGMEWFDPLYAVETTASPSG
nr:uncharacterized protein LOC123774714 [Procambarus clarkii]